MFLFPSSLPLLRSDIAKLDDTIAGKTDFSWVIKITLLLMPLESFIPAVSIISAEAVQAYCYRGGCAWPSQQGIDIFYINIVTGARIGN